MLILFYQGKIPANGKEGYYFNNIMNWTDYELERRHDFIQWLFPEASKLNSQTLKRFRKDRKLRKLIIRATLHMLLFYGYTIDVKNWKVDQVKKLYRIDRGKVIGLYSTHNYKRLTRIMRFLVNVNMSELSALVFLSLCHAMQDDLKFRDKVKQSGSLPIWMATQPYLKVYKDHYDIDTMQFGQQDESTESLSCRSDSVEDVEFGGWVVDSSSSDEDSPFQQACAGFRGLDYTGNSCYQDSVLLALFALPNPVITREILKKNINTISNSGKKWISCADNNDTDYKRRKAIQDELMRITDSMRGLEHVRYCSKLRTLIRHCPGSQAFHGTGTQDAGEFLLYLFNLFQVTNTVKQRITQVTNTMIGVPGDVLIVNDAAEVSTPLISVHPRDITGLESVNVSQFLEHIDDATFDYDNRYIEPHTGQLFSRRIEINRVVSSSYLVFSFQRTYYDHRYGHRKRAHTRVDCPETIQVDHRTLHLHAIITHVSSHYTCYIKCSGRWFFYDDDPGDHTHTIKSLGSYNKMLQHLPNPRTNGTMFFYV